MPSARACACVSVNKVRKILIIFLSLAALLCLVAAVFLAGLKREIASDRLRAERAVTATVGKIAKIEPAKMTIEIVTNAAVSPASVRVLSTSPIHFRVEAHTAWPDWMIYEYDSRTPQRGIYHYLF